MRTIGLAVIALLLSGGVAGQPGWRAQQVESFDIAWATINESFYDPAFGGLDWAAVRDELRPRILQAASPAEARSVIREMLSRLGRSHFGLFSAQDPGASAGPAIVPIDVRVTAADEIIVTRLRTGHGPRGLMPGDRLLSIDGVAMPPSAADLEALDPAAHSLEIWRRVDGALRGPRGSTVRLGVQSPGGAERETAVERVLPSGEAVRFGNLPELRVELTDREVQTPGGRQVGVIAFNFWMPALDRTIADAIDRFRSHDALVIDLRGNPGGLAAMIRGVAGHLLDEPVVLGRLRMREMTLDMPANPRRSTVDGRTVVPFAGRVALLVDGLTGSTSECFAGALQSIGRARVFGRRTMGQALPAATRRLPSGDVLMYVVGDFVTSTGSLEGTGVLPDEVVPLDRTRLAAGEDPVLESALRWVDSEERTPGYASGAVR